MKRQRTGEFDLIGRLKQMATIANPGVELGIGDDCAILAPSASPLLVTTDMLMDGRHFILSECGPEAAGYKALGVNLSDIAAMAGQPIAAFVAVALPRQASEPIALGLMRGIRSMAVEHGVALAGGDTNAWDGPLVVCITVIGRAGEGGAIRRSGARPGDAVFVTGPLGGSLLGRHLRPRPRIHLAQSIHESLDPHAMIDVSDGLAADLNHILQASGGLGATLAAGSIPIHDDARTLAARTGRSPLEHALHDGEDFELCFTAPAPPPARIVGGTPRLGLYDLLHVHRIGTIDSDPGIRLLRDGGRIDPVEPAGFDHLRSTDSGHAR